MNFDLIEYIVEEEQRLDALLAQKFPEHSRSYFQHLIDKGFVTKEGSPVKKREIYPKGSVLKIDFKPKTQVDYNPENIPLDILFEDEDLVVINKAQGLVVHPAPGHLSHTLINALVYRFEELIDQEKIRFGIVHRLDKDTSGLLIIAKHEKSHAALSKLFQERGIEKEYLAYCIGNPGNKTLHNFITRDPKDRKKFTIGESGKEAISSIETLLFSKGYSIVKINPKTGRTHQIRVHLKSIGCPVLGDPIYGSLKTNKELNLTTGQYLHAYTLSFTHPFTNENLSFTAPLPMHMVALKERLFK